MQSTYETWNEAPVLPTYYPELDPNKRRAPPPRPSDPFVLPPRPLDPFAPPMFPEPPETAPVETQTPPNATHCDEERAWYFEQLSANFLWFFVPSPYFVVKSDMFAGALLFLLSFIASITPAIFSTADPNCPRGVFLAESYLFSIFTLFSTLFAGTVVAQSMAHTYAVNATQHIERGNVINASIHRVEIRRFQRVQALTHIAMFFWGLTWSLALVLALTWWTSPLDPVCPPVYGLTIVSSGIIALTAPFFALGTRIIAHKRRKMTT